MVPVSQSTVLTSHVIVFLSYLVVPLFFFLVFYDTSLTLRNTNIICDCTFVTFGGFLIFSLTFYGTNLTKHSTNITCDCIFVTFSGSLFFFPHILWYQPYIMQYQHHMLLYFCHIWWFLFFFSSHFMVSASYCVVPT